MQRRPAALVDTLQQAQRSSADGLVGEGVAEVLDDVEGVGDVEAGKGALGAFRIDTGDDGVVFAVDKVNP